MSTGCHSTLTTLAYASPPLSFGALIWQHPDKDGEQIKHIVETLRPHRKKWRKYFPDMGVFLDWGSLHQKDPELFDPNERPEAKPEGAEREAFVADLKAKRKFYGGAEYEASRSPEEKEAFGRALGDTMDVWCARPHELPPGPDPISTRATPPLIIPM